MTLRRVLTITGVTVITLSLFALAIIIIRGINQPQNAVPSRAAEGWTQIEDTDSKIKYTTPTCWLMRDKTSAAPNHPEYDNNFRGGTIHQNMNHQATGAQSHCGFLGKGDYSTAKVTLDFTGTGVTFDKVRIGYRHWMYGHKENLSVDGKVISTFDTYKNGYEYNYLKAPPYESPSLPCGEHKIEISPAEQSNMGLDFIDVHTCTPQTTTQYLTCQNSACAISAAATATASGCLNKNAGDSCAGTTPGFLTCQNSACALSSTATATDSACLTKSAGASCTGGSTSFLTCQNSACTLSTTATATDSACLTKNTGDDCISRTNSCTNTTDCSSGQSCITGVCVDNIVCQGDTTSPAKCFDCKKDSATQSQVNILDFSCFTKYYGQNVGQN